MMAAAFCMRAIVSASRSSPCPSDEASGRIISVDGAGEDAPRAAEREYRSGASSSCDESAVAQGNAQDVANERLMSQDTRRARPCRDFPRRMTRPAAASGSPPRDRHVDPRSQQSPAMTELIHGEIADHPAGQVHENAARAASPRACRRWPRRNPRRARSWLHAGSFEEQIAIIGLRKTSSVRLRLRSGGQHPHDLRKAASSMRRA